MSASESEPWANQWEIIRPLGGGGQGDTLLVRAVSGTPQSAVLKRLKESKLKDVKARGRMHREVASLQTLATAGAKVPDFFDGNTGCFASVEVPLFFVMEHVKGETLDKFIKEKGALSLDTALNLCFDLCQTLRVAIAEGIVHRDIKPENLIVRSLEPADIVMLDFGLSFNKDAETNFTDIGETLDNSFLSLPERKGPYENKRDVRSDLTSIAGILFYCITGLAPKNLRDSKGMTPNRSEGLDMSRWVSDPVKLAHLHSFFDRGLNNDIDSRFQTLDAIESRLRQIADGSTSQPEEDFADAMKRHLAELYKIDRHNRHARYREELKPLEQVLGKSLLELQQKMKGFVISRDQSVRNRQTPAPNVIWSYPLVCRVGGHDFHMLITYSVEEDANECVVLRTLATQDRGFLPVQKERLELLRYLSSTTPDGGIIKADINRAVLKAVENLIEKIREKTRAENEAEEANQPLSSEEGLKVIRQLRAQLEAEVPRKH